MRETIHTYPPSTARQPDIDRVVEALRVEMKSSRAVYLSVPITTGKRLYDCLRATGVKSPDRLPAEVLHKFVIEPNLRNAAAIRARLALVIDAPIVDPTQYDFPGWTQSDYNVLWSTVIARLANTVVFGDGWQYSNGCAFEFVTAVRSNRAVVDDQLNVLDLKTALSNLRRASVEIGESGSAEFIQGVLKDVAKVIDSYHFAGKPIIQLRHDSK